jgi:outer membrane beta-barrel protein
MPDARHLAQGALLLVLGASGLAQAKKPAPEWEESDKLPAVQNRLYRNEHEFMAGLGVLPIDSFWKGVVLNGGYNWHITDLWAVEGRFSYLRNLKTSLRDKLEQNFAVPPEKFQEILYYGEAGVLFKPIYGKLSFMNKTLVYGEVYFSLTGVVAMMTGGIATGEQEEGGALGQHLGFGGAPGFGIRGFLNRRLSLRFDLRYLLLYGSGGGYFPLALSLNLAFTTRSDL